ncbi:hypothetical protein C0J52_03751 [Blattella germanica]|nr:hypothetical protein C0J52_03751 [Blattella germanica]
MATNPNKQVSKLYCESSQSTDRCYRVDSSHSVLSACGVSGSGKKTRRDLGKGILLCDNVL